MFEKLKQLWVKYEEIILYLILGFATTVVSWITYAVARDLIGLTVAVSNVFSWICSVTFAFITNKTWVFKSKAVDTMDLIRQTLQFYGARLATLGIETLLMYLCADKYSYKFIHLFGLDKLNYSGKILSFELINSPQRLNEMIFKMCIVSIFIIIINYILSKLVIFKKKEIKEVTEPQTAES
jgi:putative flippase GtrA